MRTHFAAVLGRESICLSGVNDGVALAKWRRHVVEQLMTPRSPYVLALQHTDDVAERAQFLDQWRELIAEAVGRLVRFGTTEDASRPCALAPHADVDAQRTAVLILAALHGGTTLSRIAQDPRPLNAALDLALAPFATTAANNPARTGNESPTK